MAEKFDRVNPPKRWVEITDRVLDIYLDCEGDREKMKDLIDGFGIVINSLADEEQGNWEKGREHLEKAAEELAHWMVKNGRE